MLQVLVYFVIVILVSFSNCVQNCPTKLLDSCSCDTSIEDGVIGLKIECRNTDGKRLNQFFRQLREEVQIPIHSLHVTDSKLKDLADLPDGLINVRHLVFNNTGIDFETLRQSTTSLSYLKSLSIYNEQYTEIPELFFEEMHELTHLELNDVGIAVISEDAFNYLEDSLRVLRLRGNKLRSIPIEIASLQHLEILDLRDNAICVVADDLTYKLESSLKSLRKLQLDRINCSCGFEKTAFASWIRSYAIRGVRCYEPSHLHGRELSITPKEDFCLSHSEHNLVSFSAMIFLLLNLLKMVFNTYGAI
ncbi:aspartate-tRNA ligase: cytoplasmic-like protein [Dinothrombium tinctorium]|uniref:Aspartate-tRNA ligase: cytoplasmic-like protein n=1 Tax=Dinothrombium tinctorium TaxID=1965070 RepID=A0A443R676_9ACAR|nr:aspartate-tRNA ligase: cytoplasmic-like protein [Dinothrombium tinctorium]